jgi:hypothetical protein
MPDAVVLLPAFKVEQAEGAGDDDKRGPFVDQEKSSPS